MTPTKTEITAQELWQLSGGEKEYELVKGELIEMTPPGGSHGTVAARISWLLLNFVIPHKLGEVMVETGFQLTSNPDTVRGPDVSFISADKMPPGGPPTGFISGPPDLAVEVVSPNDTASEIQVKVQEYVAYGVQSVWVVYPQQRTVIVHYPDGTARTLHEADILEGKPVLAGFSCRITEIFD
jgi:Uma2 family endonuclease